jgi:hypothetical protein
MAYANTVGVTRKSNEVLVTISESEVASSSEADVIALGFTKGRILRQTCVLMSGTGTTVDPVIGIATNPAGANIALENGTAAATVDNQVAGGATFFATTGNLYHRSNPDAGTDNTIVTTYHILVGWGA